jgi:DUF4097 and DUF4098 domain-containing protein YvlB
MDGAQYTFDTPRPVRLRVEIGGGNIQLSAEETTETTVEMRPLRNSGEAEQLIRDSRVEQRGDEVVVLVPPKIRGFFMRNPDIEVTIVLPTGSDLDIKMRSADLVARGSFGTASVDSGSGDVRFGTTQDARVKTGSGDVQIESVEGQLKCDSGSGDVRVRGVSGNANVSTGSGDISVDQVTGDAQLRSGSGDVTLQEAAGDVSANSASGELHVGRVGAGRLNANTASGDIHIGVAEGTPTYLDITTISGAVHSSLEGADTPAAGEPTLTLRANSASGDITLVHA